MAVTMFPYTRGNTMPFKQRSHSIPGSPTSVTANAGTESVVVCTITPMMMAVMAAATTYLVSARGNKY